VHHVCQYPFAYSTGNWYARVYVYTRLLSGREADGAQQIFEFVNSIGVTITNCDARRSCEPSGVGLHCKCGGKGQRVIRRETADVYFVAQLDMIFGSVMLFSGHPSIRTPRFSVLAVRFCSPRTTPAPLAPVSARDARFHCARLPQAPHLVRRGLNPA
jgi:hypothetical protein